MSVFYENHCGPDDSYYGPVNGVIACYNYLYSLPRDWACVSSSSYNNKVTYCSTGGSKIVGITWVEGTAQSNPWYVQIFNYNLEFDYQLGGEAAFCDLYANYRENSWQVADAARWTVDHCTRNNRGDVAGRFSIPKKW